MLLKNKVALITGCSRGIGKEMMRKFAENGSIVYANARSEGCLDEEAAELSRQYGTAVIPVYFDVTDLVQIKNCMGRIRREQRRLDVLVNNAGIMKDALIGMVEDQTIQSVFSTNVFAVIHLIQYAVKFMIRQSSGSIINMASIVGVDGNSGQTVYSASKGAIIALTKTLSKELASKGIRVNAIAPGMIDTDMFRSIGEERVSESINKIGFGRLGRAEEIADVAVLLGSDMTSYVTGQIIGVNGSAIV